MADEEKEESTATEADEPKEQATGGSKVPGGLLLWGIVGSMVVAGLVGGFALAQLLAGTDPPPPPAEEMEPAAVVPTKSFDELLAADATDGTPWRFKIEQPIIANLDEPGVTRYLRAGITLLVSGEVDQEKGTEFLSEKELLLRDSVHAYFADLSLEDVRGRRNLERIKRQVRDLFNQVLFPESKPYIVEVFFQEFAVQ